MLLKKLLVITYHFPPSAASGAFRLLGFARHLPAFGWQPLVVAPPSLPWEPTDPRLTAQIPAEAIVRPVRYPAEAPRVLRMLAQNAIWLPRAWSACKQLVREERPDAILTSGPPHCVHVLGHYLKRSAGLPWIADFRDPWINDGSPKRLNLAQRWALGWERRVFRNADLILANAPNACRMFQEAHREAHGKIVTLTNGFDPRPAWGQAFQPGQSAPMRDCQAGKPGSTFRLLHAGEIYAGRSPAPLLEALATLNGNGPTHLFQVLGRCDADLSALVQKRGWADFVRMEGQRPYEETLDSLSTADILVLFDSPGRRIGVPAKLYEYLGAGRPILALAEPDGDTAAILRSSGVLHRIAPPKETAKIGRAIAELKLEMRLEADDRRSSVLASLHAQRAHALAGPTPRFAHRQANPLSAGPSPPAGSGERFAIAGGPAMTRRIRVVHVTGCLDMGGQEKLLVEFARHADRDRFELQFLSLGERGLLADDIEALGWPVTSLQMGAGLQVYLPWQIARLLRTWQADVVHTHNDRPLIYAAPAARLARVATVIHTKHGRGAQNTRRQNVLAALSARCARHFACVSDDCARLAVEQGVPASRVRTIGNGIDLRRFPFAGPCLSGPAVTVTRICPDKDLGTLLDAAAIVIRAAPEFRLWIAGAGPSMPELVRRIDHLDLADHVRLLGPVRNVPALLRQARMFVLSSLSEGVPLAVLEAMASGLAVAATRVGGVPDIVSDGVTGLLTPPRDPAALAASILCLQRDDAMTSAMGGRGRRSVEEFHDVRRMVVAYEQLYLGRAGAKPQAASSVARLEKVQGCA